MIKQDERIQQEKSSSIAPQSTAKLVSKPEMREFRPRKGSSLAQVIQTEENKKEQVSSEHPPSDQPNLQKAEESKEIAKSESMGPAPLPAK